MDKEGLLDILKESEKRILERIENNDMKEEDFYLIINYLICGFSLYEELFTIYYNKVMLRRLYLNALAGKYNLPNRSYVLRATRYSFNKILGMYEYYNDDLFILNSFLNSSDRYDRKRIDPIEIISRKMYKNWRVQNAK